MLWSEQWGTIGLQAPAQVRAGFRDEFGCVHFGLLSHSVEALSLRPMTRRSGASGIGNNLRLKLDSSWNGPVRREKDLETSLYRPVKAFLEGLGFMVKGEVGCCDLVALKGDDPPVVVIGELKLIFNLELVLQGVDRRRRRCLACEWLLLGLNRVRASDRRRRSDGPGVVPPLLRRA